MVYISDDGTAKTAINHDIIVKGKCVICGKPAKYISAKFISPLCEDCAKAQAIKLGVERGMKPEFVEVEDYYTQPCVEMNNIKKIVALSQDKSMG